MISVALFLSRKDVELVLKMDDAIEVVEEAFKELAVGSAHMPVRQVIKIQNGTVGFMPAYLQGMNAVGVKVVSLFAQNPTKHNLPTTLAVVLLTNPENGTLLAIMDGTFLTAMRTGAASGVATKYLSRKDAAELGVIGTGVQARTQVAAVCRVRPIEKVKAYDVIPTRRESFCKEIAKTYKVTVQGVETCEDAARGSDIIITCSTSKTPVLNGAWLEEGTHVNAIGSHAPDARELDSAVIKKAKLVVDSREAALKEAGDILIPISEGLITADHIYAELGEVVAGKKLGRQNDSEITIFKSQGLAIQDVSTAMKTYELAKKKKIGKNLTL